MITRDTLRDRLLSLADDVAEMDEPPMVPPGERVPMQPVIVAPDGVVRFRANALVRYLLDNGGLDMNHLARACHDAPREDWAQFAQLIGYSVSGYGDLSYACGAVEADERAAAVLATRGPS